MKFIGIENYYGLEPLVIDKTRSHSNMINFIMNNQVEDDFEFILSNIKGKVLRSIMNFSAARVNFC